MGEFFVYMLCNPLKNDEPFYVGKGKGNRPYDHINEAKKENYTDKNHHKIRTIKKILASGDFPKIVKVDINIAEDQSFELEEFLILFIGRSDLKLGTLTNMTNGGEGLSGHKHTQEHKDYLSKISVGVPKSDSMRTSLATYHSENPDENPMKNPEIVIKNSGENHWTAKIENYTPYNKGVPMSTEQRQILSDINSGENHPNFGVPCSDSRRAKLTGQVRTEETRLKMRKPKKKTKCNYCIAEVAPHILSQYHNENCKNKV